MEKENKYAVIIAGGVGTRLWPISREEKPKQLLKLFGDRSLLRNTFDRIRKLFPLKNIIVVTSEKLKKDVYTDLKEIPRKNILGEPSAKNTTAAIWFATTHISTENSEAVITSFAADHYIKGEVLFHSALEASQKSASKGNFIVTLGIKPTSAHTGFGYIHSKKEFFKIGKIPILRVKEFKEKPDQKTAIAYITTGEYFWNANINSYKISTISRAIKKYEPQIYKLINKDVLRKPRIFRENWDKLPSKPIDTAILEKANNVLMIPGNFLWYDIGNWDVIYSLMPKSKNQNVVIGDKAEHIDIDSAGSLIYADDGVVATIGLDDLVVVKIGNRVAIFPRARAEDIKKIVAKLKKENKSNLL